jgi:coenzyme F420-reducing hydrogenase beta subunit
MVKVEKSSQDLQIEVWATEECMHCGACGAFCPHIEYNEEGAPKLVDQCWENVGLCYNSCPRAMLDIRDVDQRTFKKVRQNEAIGVYEKIVNAKPSGEKDVMAALLKTALNEKLVEVVVMPAAPFKGKGANFPIVLTEAKKIDANIPKNGTNCAGPLITGVGKAFQKDQMTKIGFLGNPCHLQAIKNTANSDFCTGADRVAFSIALMCPAGGMGSCKYCIDLTGEYADISVGGKPQGAPEGWNVLVVRSPAGVQVLEKAKKAGLIEVDEKGDLVKLEDASNKKKKKNLQARMEGKKVNVGGYTLTPDELKYFFA